MAAPNTQPIFGRVGLLGFAAQMTAANTNPDLTAGTSYQVATADATNGSYIEEIRIKANPGNDTVATVLRVWVSDGTTLSATNHVLVKEVGFPATTHSATAALPDFIVPMQCVLKPGFKIFLTLGTAPGGSGEFGASCWGEDF